MTDKPAQNYSAGSAGTAFIDTTTISRIQIDSKCRLCNEEKEETSHLYAFCNGLIPIRMRKLGSMCLANNFSWSPYQLLTMIHEIDQICPEEGTLPTQTPSQETNHRENETVTP
jgi:hypothetical protein